MSFLQPPDVVITELCKQKMAYHRIGLRGLLWAFNYPQRWKRHNPFWLFGKPIYRAELNGIALLCQHKPEQGKWVIITCWRYYHGHLPFRYF